MPAGRAAAMSPPAQQAQAPKPAPTPAPQPQQQLAADQSFSLKNRRLIDHRLRTPHRRHVNDKLLRVVAHWTSVPVGTAPLASSHTKMDIRSIDAETVVPSEEPEPTGTGLVNVRALLVPGVVDEQGKHVLKRTDIIAGNRLGETRCIMAYGGLVKKGSDGQQVKGLVKHLKGQCGLDLSPVSTWYKFLQLEYRDGNPTVFFVPALWELTGDMKIIPQATEEKKDVEEEYEEEEVDEEKTAAAVEKRGRHMRRRRRRRGRRRRRRRRRRMRKGK